MTGYSQCIHTQSFDVDNGYARLSIYSDMQNKSLLHYSPELNLLAQKSNADYKHSVARQRWERGRRALFVYQPRAFGLFNQPPADMYFERPERNYIFHQPFISLYYDLLIYFSWICDWAGRDNILQKVLTLGFQYQSDDTWNTRRIC